MTASHVVSDTGTTLQAGRDVTIAAAQETSSEQHYRKETKSGIFGGGGGIGFTIGSRMQSADQTGTHTTAAASTVGSVGGDVNIIAGNAYQQVGSDVMAPKGDVNVVAKEVQIVEARETGSSATEQRFKQSGLSVSIGSPVISAIQTADNMADAARNTSRGRMQALAAAATALNVKNSVGELQGAAKALAGGDPSKAASISVSLGSSKSQSNTAQTSDSARGSTVKAGGHVNIVAQGAGADSSILVRGSDITAGQDANLAAEGDIRLQAAQNTASLSGRSSSSSGSIGVSVGGQTGITISASKGRGNQAGDDLTHTNTHIAAGNSVTLQSGGDTTLKGAVVSGKQVVAEVGGDLKLESLQGSSSYASRNQTVGGSLTISPAGVPIGGGLNAGQSKVNSNYQSVTEQSGIQAGDGGFQVNVKGDTDLKGAVIASNQTAVEQGKNRFNTEGALTTSDLHNSAHYEGQAVGVNASVGNDAGKFGVKGVGAGVGQDSGSAQGTTTAGISGIAGDQSVRTGDATGIERIFDQNKVQREIDAQVAITAEFGKQASKAVGDYAQAQTEEARRLREQARAESDPQRRSELETQAKKLEDAWGDNGSLRLAAHTVIGGLTGGVGGAAGAAVGTLTAPAVAHALSDAGITGTLADVLTAAASTAAGAVVGGTSGAAAAGNEVTNNYLTHNQAREKDRKLANAKTDEERKQIAQEYKQLDETQRKEAGMCLVNDQCRSVFDKESLKSVLAELNTACSPPRYCTADEKASIQELNQFYAIRNSVKPDTMFEEILLGNKIISSAFKGVVALYGRLTAETATIYSKPLGVVSDFEGKAVKVFEAAPQYGYKVEGNISATGANLENSAAQFVKDEAGKDFIGILSSKTGNNNGIDIAYAKMVNGQPQLVIGEAKAGDSALTALGESKMGTLNRNLNVIRDSIENTVKDADTKKILLDQLRDKTYQVELYTSVNNAAKTAGRVDDVLLQRMGTTVSRVVTFERVK
ncbi:hemagglutinin repeat-containing protein [Comamonas testosteroni]|uniref:Filamentous hemagglutinin n=1 Tax=Comamonas testosteroni TaxID=285 RepID=A0A8B4S4W1_COMTE|nr:hemagglutinin repeat-containing protein [Comamonas testosteroni]QQN68676.1 hemagglutinin repeat-containing protein [Comamonas testosteroni]SUY78031.1 Filamentous hemagglutinin [Comamonas testosteroni]